MGRKARRTIKTVLEISELDYQVISCLAMAKNPPQTVSGFLQDTIAATVKEWKPRTTVDDVHQTVLPLPAPPAPIPPPTAAPPAPLTQAPPQVTLPPAATPPPANPKLARK